ncbi:unnamed protein product [Effrenium voratum]|nr:unnamed protein product [Effrenium voratum]
MGGSSSRVAAYTPEKEKAAEEPRPSEDEPELAADEEPVVIRASLRDGKDGRKKPRVLSGFAPEPARPGQSPQMPQPQPVRQRVIRQPAVVDSANHMARAAQMTQMASLAVQGQTSQSIDERPPSSPELLKRHLEEEAFEGAERRRAQETSALSAVRARAGNGNPRRVPAALAAANVAVKPEKPRFPEVEVSISARKVLLQWVRFGRKVLKEKLANMPQKRRQKKPLRVDRLVELFLESQDELERMCLEDPEELIHSQIELLTRRIDEIEEQVRKERELALKAQAAAQARRQAQKQEAAGSEAQRARQLEQSQAVQEVALDWDTVFDSAVAKRDAWKKQRGQQQQMAENLWRKKAVIRQPTLASESAKAGKSDIAEQLRKERERMEDLLSIFEAQQRRRKRKDQQPMLDLAEALHEEQREAMAQRAEELREERRREAERRRLEEERQRQREEEERRRQEEEAEAEQRERDRLALERLRREKLESERRRAEERRQAEEREAQQRREMEEKFRKAEETRKKMEEQRRQAAERMEAERRKEAERRLEEERKREEARLAEERRKEEERLAEERRQEEERLEEERRKEEQRLEEERRREEQRIRQEEERRRLEAEERRREEERLREERRREAERERLEEERRERERLEEERKEAERLKAARPSRGARIDSAFDNLEDACDEDEDEEDEDEDEDEEPGSSTKPRRKKKTAADWAERALLALDGDSEEESDEEGGVEADMQLVKLTGAIAKKIDKLHN